MKSVSKVALGAALAVAGASMAATPALAQQKAQQQAQFNYTAEERAALAPVQTAIAAKDYATATAGLAAAQAAAKGADARYTVGRFQFDIGVATNNQQLQSQGIDAMLASGASPAVDLPALYNNQGALAAGLADYKKAETAFARVVELKPSDAEAIAKLAEVKSELNKPVEAATLYERAIQVRAASGQPAPEGWYKRALNIAYSNRQAAESIRLSQALVKAYPSKENWRDALLIYRDVGQLDQATALDLLRLMRSSNALAGERDYYQFAAELRQSGLPGEVKGVMEEGVVARMIDPAKADFKSLLDWGKREAASDERSLGGEEAKALAAASGTQAVKIADAYFGYGNYAKAVSLYRAALQKGGVDANVVNTRLGMALAHAKQKAEAEAAFKAVTGPRAQLASFWLLWLNQSA